MYLFKALDHVCLTRGYREVLHGEHGDLEPYAEERIGTYVPSRQRSPFGQQYHFIPGGVVVKAKDKATGKHVDVILEGDRYIY
jgi:hypothetical protein